MRKTILIVSALEPWSMNNNIGAPSLYETLKGYSDAEYQITYLTFTKNEKVKSVSHSKNIDSKLPNLRTLRVEKKAGTHLFGNRISMKLNRLFFYPNALKNGVTAYLTQVDKVPDIIYGYEEQAVYAISKLPKQLTKSAKIIHRFQGTILGKNYDSLFHGLRKYETYRALKLKADLYIMTNDGTFGDKAIKYLNPDVTNSNLFFPRNGFNFEQFNQICDKSTVLENFGLNPNHIFAFTVSRLTYWKRVDRAIELIKTFHQKYPQLHLIIVGDGEYKDQLQEMVLKYNIENKVHFLGGLGREQVAELMSCLDIFLSLYDVSNLGNPLFEALISGQCIITLNNGTTANVITHNNNGIIVEPNQKKQLENEFEIILNNSQKRNDLKKSAKRWAFENLYSWGNRMKNEISWIESN